MKTQPGRNTAGPNRQQTAHLPIAWRAILARAFHAFPGDQVSRPQDKLADLVVDEAVLNELRRLVGQLNQKSVPGSAVLITGEAGTGKTMLARALAGEAGTVLFSLRLDAVSAQGLAHLMQLTRESAPAVVLLEAVDDGSQQHASQFSVALRQLAAASHIMLLGAARCTDQVDPSFLQPGLFDRQIHLDLPDRQARQQILALQTRAFKLDKDVNLGMIARVTTGFSGGDLLGLCRQAAEYSVQRSSRGSRPLHSSGALQGNGTLQGSGEISMTDFEQAIDLALLASAGKPLVQEQARRVLAYHEAGHALAAWMNPAAEPIQRISLLHRWQIAVRPETMPGFDQVGVSKAYLLALLSVLLAGRAGEAVGLGEITTGAENDLVEATALARRMVSRWGMGHLGPVSFDQLATQVGVSNCEPTHSETTAASIDRDVQKLLTEQYQAVCQQLKAARPALDRLAEALLEDETVHQKELVRLLGPRPLYNDEETHLPAGVSEVSPSSKVR